MHAPTVFLNSSCPKGSNEIHPISATDSTHICISGHLASAMQRHINVSMVGEIQGKVAIVAVNVRLEAHTSSVQIVKVVFNIPFHP